jgi:hypothetical protein
VYSDRATEPSPVSTLCWQIHRRLAVLVPLLRMWVHCPRASNGLLPRRSNLVGYVQWDAQFDLFLLCQTIMSSSFSGRSLIRFLRTFGAGSSARQLAKLAILLLLRLTDQCLEFSPESVSRLFGENVSSHSVSTGCGSPDDELAPKVRKNPFKRSSTAKPLAS